MPALSRLSPLRSLALLRRVPFWAQALAVCALFAIVGVAVLDDYGVTGDEIPQRHVAAVIVNYALGVSEEPPPWHERYYGVAFEMPLLLVERALGLQDSRHIYLMRHLLTHLFFIAGGFVCGMLAYRMLGSRWIALLVILLFLLHPRLYAHSFFNTKDIPFAVMLVIALYLTHRAFRRDTVEAFLLCGIGVGLAINLRPFGLMLLPMLIAMRALDLWQAGRAERKRILESAGIFLVATLGTVYIIHPYYWGNPLRFIEGARVLSQHPVVVNNLFMGEIYRSDTMPWNYIPVWFAITAPPATLLLGAVGAAAVCWQGVAHPLRALRDHEIRFRVLLLGCFALPVAATIILQSDSIYTGWRHMYFMWGPFCLLAAVGLHRLASAGVAGEAARGVAARLPGWIRGGELRRTLAYGVAGFGLITTLTAMAALHPHEQVYFNALTDTKTPDALGERYDMDYYAVAHRQSLEYLLARYPDDALRVYPKLQIASALILPKSDRERIVIADKHEADFYLKKWSGPPPPQWYATNQPTIHSIQAYGSAIVFTVAKDVDAYRASYDDVAANGMPLARAAFDIYIHSGELYYLKADCEPLAANALDLRIFLHIIPDDPTYLPADSRERGFENLDFLMDTQAAFFDGKCIHRQPLPDYPIARIRTGQDSAVMSSGDEWRVDVDLATYAAAQALYDGIAAGDYGLPVARSDFEVYLRGSALAYLKEPCAADDADARFFLHIFPADPTDLPADGLDRGFANMDFGFADYGGRVFDKCVAERELPDYAIERIRTGQFVSGEGDLWRVELPVAQ